MEKGGGVGKIRGTRSSVLVTLTLSYFFLPRLSVRELWVLRLCEIHREEPILPHRVILILHLKESTLSGLLKSYRIWGLAAPSQFSHFSLVGRPSSSSSSSSSVRLFVQRPYLIMRRITKNSANERYFILTSLLYSRVVADVRWSDFNFVPAAHLRDNSQKNFRDHHDVRQYEMIKTLQFILLCLRSSCSRPSCFAFFPPSQYLCLCTRLCNWARH